MKKTLAAATVATLAALTGAASAADFGRTPSLKDGPILAPYFIPAPVWTGFYVGAHIGGAWADLQTTDVDHLWAPYGPQWTNSHAGVIGGGQAGFNWQTGPFVIGVEADFGGTGLAHSVQLAPWRTTDNSSAFYADVTGRLGYALGATLFYAKGGWAYTDTDLAVRDTGYRCGAPACSLSSNGLNGWTIGGGIEHKFLSSWGAKIEYRYFDFGNVSGNLYPGFESRFERNLTANAITVGVNYYLRTPYLPLK